jgi:hypothetical protein
MTWRFVLAAAAMAVALPAAAAPKPPALSASDKDGIVAADLLPPPAGFFDRLKWKTYVVLAMPYRPDQDLTTNGPSGGVVILQTWPDKDGPQLAVYKAKPGTYLITELSIAYWSACLRSDTRSFEVKPGQVTYLGRIDPTANLQEVMDGIDKGLLKKTVRATNGVGTPERLVGVSKLNLTPPEGDGWKEAVSATLAKEAPAVIAPLVAAQLTPVHTSAEAQGKVCGPFKFNF